MSRRRKSSRSRKACLASATPRVEWRDSAASSVGTPKFRAAFSYAVAGLFFVLYYLYVRYYIDPQLLYYANDVSLPSGQLIEFPFFLSGQDFFQEFVGRPGGLVEYVAALGSQYYYYPSLGPLVLALVACLAFVFTDWLIRADGHRGALWLRYVAPLLLFIVYSRYTFRLENCLAPVVALAAATGYVLATRRTGSPAIRFVAYAVIAVALYYAVGGPFLLFVVWCGVHELLGRRRFVLGGSCLLIALGIPLLGMCLSHVTGFDAYFRPSGIFPAETTAFGAYSAQPDGYSLVERVRPTVMVGFYVFFAFVAVVLPFGRQLASLGSTIASRTGKVGVYFFSGKLAPARKLLVLAAICACVACFAPDRDVRTVLRANYLARLGNWREFLDEIDRYPTREFPLSVMLDVNRALYETGQLESRLFAYPQNRDALLCLGSRA
ncbi:MAG: DUF6057 family protein, partial [Planctomycetota bacterium]